MKVSFSQCPLDPSLMRFFRTFFCAFIYIYMYTWKYIYVNCVYIA